MSARAKKLVRLAIENNTMEENDGTTLSEPQTLCRTTTSVSNEEPHLSNSQRELTATPIRNLMESQQEITTTYASSVNPQPSTSTSQCDSRITRHDVTEGLNFYVIQSTTSTRSVLKRVSTADPRSPSGISENYSEPDEKFEPVLPVPMGQTSAFFYKFRLNCYNFTVSSNLHFLSCSKSEASQISVDLTSFFVFVAGDRHWK